MSEEIPVGSPPAPPGRHAAPSGWYPDPVDQRQERYWDGWQWSRTTRAVESQPQQPYGQPVPPVQHYGQPQYGQAPYGQAPYPQQPYPGQYAPVAAKGLLLTADQVPVSGWWWRVLAGLVDSIIVGLLAVIPSWSIYQRMLTAFGDFFADTMEAAQAGQPPPPTPPVTDLISLSDQLLLAAIQVGITFVYVALFLGFRGATPGKSLCGLRVVPVDQGQHRGGLPWPTTIIRATIWAVPGINGTLAIFQLIDILFPLWHPKRQAIHDIIAKTQVVRPGPGR